MQNRTLIERQIRVFWIVEKLDVVLDPGWAAFAIALIFTPFAWADILNL